MDKRYSTSVLSTFCATQQDGFDFHLSTTHQRGLCKEETRRRSLIRNSTSKDIGDDARPRELVFELRVCATAHDVCCVRNSTRRVRRGPIARHTFFSRAPWRGEHSMSGAPPITHRFLSDYFANTTTREARRSTGAAIVIRGDGTSLAHTGCSSEPPASRSLNAFSDHGPLRSRGAQALGTSDAANHSVSDSVSARRQIGHNGRVPATRHCLTTLPNPCQILKWRERRL